MAVKLKLSALFDPRDERLPTKTGIGGRLKPFRKRPLFEPKNTIAGNPAVKAQLAQFKVADPKQVRAASRERLALAVDKINRHIKESIQFKGLRFDLDEESNRSVATIRDVKTGEVLKEIPPQGVLEIAANLRDASGLFVNRKG
jgi:flagellar protein FlaG